MLSVSHSDVKLARNFAILSMLFCSGGHFASGEILPFIVVLLVLFNIQSIAGEWVEVKKDFVMNVSLPRALDKVELRPTAKLDSTTYGQRWGS